jgi:hypothetical protein
MTTPEPRLIYTVAQLAAFLGHPWGEDSLRREIKAGRLRSRKPRGTVLIVHTDMLAWVDGLPVDPDYRSADEPRESVPGIARTTNPATAGHRRVMRRFEILPPSAQEAVE